MVDTNGVPDGHSKRTSGRLGQPAEASQERRLSGRQSKPVQKLTPTESRAYEYEDQITAAKPPQTAHPALDEDVIALIEAPPQMAEPAPPPPVQKRQPQKPQLQVPIDDDTRYLIKKDAEAVRDSRRLLQPAKRNEKSALTEDQPDKLPPVNGKHGKDAPPVGAPSTRPPSDADYEKDASGSRRIYLMRKPEYVTPNPPVLTLTHKIERALAGKGRFEMDVLSMRGGRTTVCISVDLIEKHQCGIIIQHTTGKGTERLAHIYRASHTNTQPGVTGVENALDDSQIDEHNAHKDLITSYAIPDANANWVHVRKWVHRSADGSLFGRGGVSLVRTIEQISTLITHRTTLGRYLNAVCELSRTELDARKATRLVLAQGLAWNEKQGAPKELLDAQAQLRDEYDVLIARWNATYICAQQLARQYGLPLTMEKKASIPTQAAHAAS